MAATTPVSTPAPSCPVTTLTYSSPVTIPATHSTGISSGLTIFASSITTSLVTTVTVPQVQFTTSTITVNGQTSKVTGLAAGAPSSVAATPTAGAIGASVSSSAAVTPAAGAAGTSAAAALPGYATTAGASFGTSFAPSATRASSSSVLPYTGAGVKLSGGSFAGLAVGAVVVLFLF